MGPRWGAGVYHHYWGIPLGRGRFQLYNCWIGALAELIPNNLLHLEIAPEKKIKNEMK